MADKKYDAIVIGAGPAGSSASRKLVAEGMKTLLIEKRRLPRQKICSGLLLFDGVEDFIKRRFGVIPESVYCNPNFLDGVALYLPSFDDPVIISSKIPIPNLWRARFDYFLATNCGAEIKDGLKLDRIEDESNGFKVICSQTGRRKKTRVAYRSKYLVAADGGSSYSVQQMIPNAYMGLPKGKCFQVHYRGKINLSHNLFNVFLYNDVGMYPFANMKDDHIYVCNAGIGKCKIRTYHENLVSLLKNNYGLKIKEVILKEGTIATVSGPMNRFNLGKENFLVAGDAAGFIHSGGEGISCALTSGELAGEAILTAEKTSCNAIDVYRNIARDEVELCLDMFNPLRKFKTYPIFPLPMDFKSIWHKYPLREFNIMRKDLKAFGSQIEGISDIGVSKIMKRNLFYRLFHRHYPVNL